MSVTSRLASFIEGCPVGSAPAFEQTRRAVLDCIGVTLLGSLEATAAITSRYAERQGSSGAAAVLGARERRLSASAAALANGTAAHALDYDDIGLRVGHPTAVVMPAAMAVAEQTTSSGRDFLEAMVIGYEVAHRFAISAPFGDRDPYKRGFHSTSVYGIFGATAAAARLLRLNATQVAHAIGIAASSSSGLRANFGSMTKPFHVGSASASGVRSALLAADGLTASPDAVEGRYGWAEAIGECEGTGTATMTLALGDRFAIEEGLWFKGFPCCGANHAAIDGVLKMMEVERLGEAEIDRIEVTLHPKYSEVLVYPWPSTGLEGKFSLAFNVAAAVVDGMVTPDTYVDTTIERLAPVRGKIETRASSALAEGDAAVFLRTIDGREFRTTTHERSTVRGNSGSPSAKERILRGTVENPLSWDELSDKFLANARSVIPETAAKEAVCRIRELDDLEFLEPLTRLLIEQAPR